MHTRAPDRAPFRPTSTGPGQQRNHGSRRTNPVRPRRAARRWRLGIVLGVAGIASVAGCDRRPLSMGDVNAIVVTAAPELWNPIGEQVLDALEGLVFTVRDEAAFRVSYQDPADEVWLRLRLLKQQLVIGTASDPWVAAAVDASEGPVEAPTIVQVPDLWSRGQLVTALVLPEGIDADAGREIVLGSVEELREIFDAQYREWVVARMFVTGPDAELAETLRGEHGFSLLVPEVYEYTLSDPVHIFRNDNPNPADLIRQFSVSWRSAVPEEVTDEYLLDWRAQVVADHYDFPQVVNRDRWMADPEEVGGRQAYTVRAIWENPPGEFPAAGPFITRTVTCPQQQRIYLIDAWLYAPGVDKFEYMIQLDEIMNSFECGGN